MKQKQTQTETDSKDLEDKVRLPAGKDGGRDI